MNQLVEEPAIAYNPHLLSAEEKERIFAENQLQMAKIEFVIGLTAEAEAFNKLGNAQIQINHLLNDNLKLTQYIDNEKVRKLFLCYQIRNTKADRQNTCVVTDRTVLSRKFKRLYAEILFPDYEAFVNADRLGALKIMAQQTLRGVTLLEKYSKQLGFKWLQLYQDMEQLFVREKLL